MAHVLLRNDIVMTDSGPPHLLMYDIKLGPGRTVERSRGKMAHMSGGWSRRIRSVTIGCRYESLTRKGGV
jgi:hypothetical protein